MKQANTIVAILLALVSFGLLVSCGEGETTASNESATYEDGVYFAIQDSFADSGWRYNVTLVAEDGKITDASWNGSNINAGVDKVTLSESGGYPMVSAGGASAEWHEQAAEVEKAFIASQSTDVPDAISGATIGYGDFFELAEKALEAGPVGYGPYKDGVYHAEGSEFDNGYRYFIDITVTSGYVVAAHWDAYAEEGEKLKAQISADGEYGMVENGGAMAPWFEQAHAVEEYLIDSQSTTKPDAISGASIHTDGFFALAQEALAGASR